VLGYSINQNDVILCGMCKLIVYLCQFVFLRCMMPGQHCVVCDNSKQKDPDCSFYKFTSNPERRKRWLQLLEITEAQLTPHSRACLRHFPAGDNSNDPQINLGKRFASPIKQKLPRAKREKARNSRREASTITLHLMMFH